VEEDQSDKQQSTPLRTGYDNKRTREKESVDQRKARLSYQRTRSTSKRSSENADERQTRLSRQQKRSASNRLRRSEHGVSEKRQKALLTQYKWPSAIPTQLKNDCLQAFSNHMSMSVLRQSTCIICNTRAYSSTMKECALEEIPNVERLSCHADLIEIFSTMQEELGGKQYPSEMEYMCTISFRQMKTEMRVLFVYQTQYSIKRDTIPEQRLGASVNNAILL
jgi:hypothetical protein